MSALRAGAAIQRPLGGLGGLCITGRIHPDTHTHCISTPFTFKKRHQRRRRGEGGGGRRLKERNASEHTHRHVFTCIKQSAHIQPPRAIILSLQTYAPRHTKRYELKLNFYMHHILNIHPKTFQMNGHMPYLLSNNHPYFSNYHKLYGSPSTFHSTPTMDHSITQMTSYPFQRYVTWPC